MEPPAISQIKVKQEIQEEQDKPEPKLKRITKKIREHILGNFLLMVFVYGFLITLMFICLMIKTPWLIINIISKIIGWGVLWWFISEEFVDLFWRFRRR